jgi:ABC-type multidrug transport system fused ATPase/permease subunit
MSAFFRLFSYLKKYQPYIYSSIICNVLMSLFMVVSMPALYPFLQILFEQSPKISVQPSVALSFSSLLDYVKYYFSMLVETRGRETALAYTCVLIVGLFFGKNLFRYLSLFFMAPVRNGIVSDFRSAIFDKILALPIGYFSEERKGDLISRITNDVQEVEWSVLSAFEAMFRSPIVIIGSIAYMFVVSAQLTFFVLILIVFTVVIIGGLSKSLKNDSGEAQVRLGNLVSIVEETIGGSRIIKSFNAENYQNQKFTHENISYKNILTKILWRNDLASPLSEFLGIMIVAILLWYGSSLVFGGKMEAATFFTFLLAFYNVIEPAKALSTAFYNTQKGLASFERIETVLQTAISIEENPNPQKINFQQAIQFKNVSFSYKNSDQKVLDNINLTIPKGKIVAIVGASGSGKSTLSDLLPRFYDVEAGEILIDGVNIKDISLKNLRAQIAIVSQDAVLFNDTIANNIRFGNENAAQTDLENAAKTAFAHDFITATEHGYSTNIGDRGMKLSGGQRQRLTIARAVLKNPPILILDEATSALDSESEKWVQQALNNVMQNRTAIVIAHRLTTIQNADEIVVLNAGRIVEQGTHEELLQKRGDYFKLVQLQTM